MHALLQYFIPLQNKLVLIRAGAIKSSTDLAYTPVAFDSIFDIAYHVNHFVLIYIFIKRECISLNVIEIRFPALFKFCHCLALR